MEKELKPCPFCGDENPRLMLDCGLVTGETVFIGIKCIECSQCGARGKATLSRDTAMAFWNSRVNEKEAEKCCQPQNRGEK
jgi:Lar family restriction alleviation protein